MSTDQNATVKVRFRGDRRFLFYAGDGRVSNLRVHAASFTDVESATRCANALAEPGSDVVAAAVMKGKRRVHHVGESTPPAPPAKYGPAAGYRYLVGVTAAGRAVFEIRNEDGSWGRFDIEMYEACAEEAERAGVRGAGMNVHGATSTIVTRGLRFTQHYQRALAV